MEKGQGLYLAGNYQGAADVFEGGFKQYPYSAFLFNAGVCYQKLSDSDRALGKFRDYLQVDPSAPDADKVKQRIGCCSRPPRACRPRLKLAVRAAAVAWLAAAAVVRQSRRRHPSMTRARCACARRSSRLEPPRCAAAFLFAHRRQRRGLQAWRAEPGWVLKLPMRARRRTSRCRSASTTWWSKSFRDFNESHADIDVSPGHVYQFKSQPVAGRVHGVSARLRQREGRLHRLDDKQKERPFGAPRRTVSWYFRPARGAGRGAGWSCCSRP